MTNAKYLLLDLWRELYEPLNIHLILMRYKDMMMEKFISL